MLQIRNDRERMNKENKKVISLFFAIILAVSAGTTIAASTNDNFVLACRSESLS